MLDFAIKLNNTKYLTCLEKSTLWKKLTDITLDTSNYSKDRKSFERLLLYMVADWRTMLAYDHFGRPSIFTKLLKQVVERCPAALKVELDLEAAQKLDTDSTQMQMIKLDPSEVKSVAIPTESDLEVKEYFEDLTQVAFVVI
jgi:hypothetical protein